MPSGTATGADGRFSFADLGVQFNVENVSDRAYRMAKESEFTPAQFSPPRLVSGSPRLRF